MTASATIKQADLRRMANVAKETGVCVEVEIGGRIVRIFPDRPSTRSQRDARVDDDEEIIL